MWFLMDHDLVKKEQADNTHTNKPHSVLMSGDNCGTLHSVSQKSSHL